MPTLSEEKASPVRRRDRYPREFRRDAASLVVDQMRTVADVARELGVAVQTLGDWVRQERVDRGERELTISEMREEDVKLRREVKRLIDRYPVVGPPAMRGVAAVGVATARRTGPG